ncbi:hypothetical protein LCGC14_2233180 [marine sediment metagenome]|uniref:Uncharacterized protein n=1 Tax=marine sediment metagenome TaxID=412755 RepID=A0A0F9G2Q5_9ZZZZ
MAKTKIDVGDVEPGAGFVGPPAKPLVAGRQKREPREVKPQTLSERQLVKARMLSDNLMERRRALVKETGNPFGSGPKMDDKERRLQYQELISSREMLFNAIAGAALVGKDGRLRLSNKMVDAFVALGGGTS